MKQYFLKTTSVFILLALAVTAGYAQDDKKESSTTIKRNDDIIIIKPKTDVNTKLSIEIKGEDVKINGKPLDEYKSDDVIISRRRHVSEKREVEEWENEPGEPAAPRPPSTRFRGGATVYGYGGADNMATTIYSNGNKAFLGVGSEKTGEGEGVSITSVSGNSGADKAGLKEGDIITKINDNKINSPEELTKAIGKFNPDDKITITYKRDKKEQKTTAILAKRKVTGAMSYAAPQPFEFKKFNLDNNMNYNFSFNGKPRLGLKAQETEDGKGLKVLDVDDESAADKAGIKEGDIITTFDGAEVNNIDKLRELSQPAIDKGNFKIKLIRDGKPQEIDVKIPKKLKTTSL